jgi:type I restriction enzyme M protein
MDDSLAGQEAAASRNHRTPETVFATVAGREFATEKDCLAALAGVDVPPAVRKELVKLAAVPDPEAPVIRKRNGDPEPDPDLRDQENVALPDGANVGWEADVAGRLASPEYVEAVERHVKAEVHPYVPDAWVDHAKTRIGYEVPLTRHFYIYVPPRPLTEINAEIRQLEAEIEELLRTVTG